MATPPEPLDEAKVKAFTERMISHINGASVSLMIEIGRRGGSSTRWAAVPAATSAVVAEQAGLTERYVREWLGAMVCGGVVEFEAATGTYRLPPEHAALLTGQTTRNLTTTTALFPLLTRVLPDVVEAFRQGGGVPYSAFQPEFTGLMDVRSRPRYDENLFGKYLAAPDDLIKRLEQGIRVADIGCGSGYCIGLMAERFPRSTFVGYDLSEPAIAQARSQASALGLQNAHFEIEDVRVFPVEPPFDLITAFDAIHDQVDPAAVLSRVRQALSPGGMFLMLDVHASSNLEDNLSLPHSPLLYTVSTMHCMTVSLAHGGVGLGTAWGSQVADRMLRAAGFSSIRLFERVDPLNSLYVAT